MKKIKHFLKNFSAIAIAFIVATSALVLIGNADKAFAASSDITEQDLIKLSEGLNMSTDSEIYDLGTNPFKIFDADSEGFKDLFTSSSITDAQNYSITGSSRSEMSSAYSNQRAMSAAAGIKVPIYNVSANIETNFQTSVSSALNYINDEYYEYFERYQQTRVITVNWLAKDLSTYFSSDFISELTKIDTVAKARTFLEKYGTHTFSKYYMGGSLIITNYIASEKSIAEVYESQNKSIGLNAQIANAVSANAAGSDYNIEANNVSNETTKSQMRMRARGGKNFNALTVDDLFTYKQEYFTGGGSGYIYSDWIKSLDSHQNEVVIDADDSISIFDLIKNSQYYDAVRENLLIQAFDTMSYSNYARLCAENGINSDIIGDISYTANGTNVEFSITNDTILLPKGVVACFSIGKTVTGYFDSSAVTLELASNLNIASLQGNELTIAENAQDGSKLIINIKLNGTTIHSLNVEVSNDNRGYANGYGTVDQPYIIADPSQWKAFIDSDFDRAYYYQLANDIDLRGDYNYEVGGSSTRSPFIGVLNGNGHKLSNFSVIAKSEWQYMGILGINSGTIENLTLDNVKVMNFGIVQASNGAVNAGILIGYNSGVIKNIIVKNSSVRVSSQLNNSQLNLGAVCGMSIGSISDCGVSSCNLYGQTWKGNGTANVGGIAGQLSGSDITNSYVRNSSINVSNVNSDSAKYTLGGLVGFVYSDTAEETENPIKSNVTYSIAYGNTFNKNSNAFGYIAGKSSANNSFNNCYYESMIEKSVNGSSMNGCRALRDLSLTNIGNALFNQNWITDSDGVILKSHLER